MVTEVDGTMGKSGVATDATHGVPTEIDGTMGNPGVPARGHGIHHQMMLGGGPSAAKIDGRMSCAGAQLGGMGSGLHQPFSEGPYELVHEGR